MKGKFSAPVVNDWLENDGLLCFLHLPPVWLAALMAVGWGISRMHSPLSDSEWSIPVGAILIVAGLVLITWSVLCFWRARTSVVPRRVPEALVGDGPYRFSRNPIYLADLLILAGWGLILGAPLALLLVLPMLWMLREWFVKGEEEVLAERFGGAYADYCARVRRWI